jgi:DNA-binding transcriptional MocR family regulator
MGAQIDSLEYERVAGIIERQIETGALRAAERVPSLRTMSRHAGVSIGTVVQAYLHLEQRGLLEARPRSGYFVAKRSAIALALPTPRKAEMRRPRGVSREVVDTVIQSFSRTDLVALGSAISMSATSINGRLNALTRRTLREVPALPNVHSSPPGLPELRGEIAKRMALCGLHARADDVFITNGTMEALTLSLGVLCGPGDTVLVESPTYFGILQLAEHLRLKVVEVPNHAASGIDVDALERVVGSTKLVAAVLQSSFNNPSGALTPDAAKRRIVAVLAKHGVPLIEDDIYSDLHFGQERPTPFAAFDNSGNVITCGSISKSLAIGYRIGWAIGPRYTDALIRAKFCTTVGCATLQQHVTARYLRAGLLDRHLRRVRNHLRDNCERFGEAIAASFPSDTRASQPAGGVVLWIELPRGVDGVALFHAALERGVGIAPGIIFSARAEYRNFIRMSAGMQWTPTVANAIAVLGRLATR